VAAVEREQQITQEPLQTSTQDATKNVPMRSEVEPLENTTLDSPEKQAITNPKQLLSTTSSQIDIATDDEPELRQETLGAAFWAERQAKHSRNSFIFSLITLTIPVLGLLVSLIFFTIGWIFLRRAARGRYITNRGEKIESTARVLWIIYMAIIAAIAILIASVFFLF
jgi:ABC-type multidrug transport system permease subunit